MPRVYAHEVMRYSESPLGNLQGLMQLREEYGEGYVDERGRYWEVDEAMQRTLLGVACD